MLLTTSAALAIYITTIPLSTVTRRHCTSTKTDDCHQLFQTKTRNDSDVTPDATSSGDTILDEQERLKKVRNLKKKLQQIEKLKQQQAAGKTLELNQREKLSREEEVLDELAQLQL